MAEGYVNEWVVLPVSGHARVPAFLDNLAPGRYLFRLKAKVGNSDWRVQQTQLEIIITPPFWKTWWFWTSVITALSLLIYLIVKWKVRSVRQKERQKASHEKELLEMEARALRSQMNPHFIFNCLNSIKSLIQQHEEEKSVTYLTTFSKLIRTLFNNADKKEITLYDELETCKLYLQLEAMRFGSRFSYTVNIDPTLDLKSLQVPALIIQPFIENAIWHGIVPKKEGGTVDIRVQRENGYVTIVIDDDGIGRTVSQQNRSAGLAEHQSKGVNLTQSRLELDNLLRQRQATLETIDKFDEQGKPAGTTVMIRITEDPDALT
jgi:LytS/YehU family sensor histidine kinase